MRLIALIMFSGCVADPYSAPIAPIEQPPLCSVVHCTLIECDSGQECTCYWGEANPILCWDRPDAVCDE